MTKRFPLIDQVVDKLLYVIAKREHNSGQIDRMIAKQACFARDAEAVRKMTTEELRKS